MVKNTKTILNCSFWIIHIIRIWIKKVKIIRFYWIIKRNIFILDVH